MPHRNLTASILLYTGNSGPVKLDFTYLLSHSLEDQRGLHFSKWSPSSFSAKGKILTMFLFKLMVVYTLIFISVIMKWPTSSSWKLAFFLAYILVGNFYSGQVDALTINGLQYLSSPRSGLRIRQKRWVLLQLTNGVIFSSSSVWLPYLLNLFYPIFLDNTIRSPNYWVKQLWENLMEIHLGPECYLFPLLTL